MKENWHLRLYIIERVYLDSTLVLAKPCPPKHRQAQIHRGGNESIDVSAKFENVRDSSFASFTHEIVCKLLKYPIVAVLVGFCKVAFCDMLAKPEVIALVAMHIYDDYQVSQALTVG